VGFGGFSWPIKVFKYSIPGLIALTSALWVPSFRANPNDLGRACAAIFDAARMAAD
jgi:hypothetical protein